MNDANQYIKAGKDLYNTFENFKGRNDHTQYADTGASHDTNWYLKDGCEY
jgi:hypothetical protein